MNKCGISHNEFISVTHYKLFQADPAQRSKPENITMTRIINTHFFFVHIAEKGSPHAAIGGSIIAQNNKAAACISEFGAWLPTAVWFAVQFPFISLLFVTNPLLDQVHPTFITINCNLICCIISF